MISLAQLIRPWWELPVVVIDFETCGVDPATTMPVEIAAVRVVGGKVVAGHAELIDPGCFIPEEASAIHGITNEMVRGALKPHAAIEKTLEIVGALDAVPCGYNGHSYDRTILHRLSRWANAPCEQSEWPWLDPLIVIRHIDRYVAGKGRHKLTSVCERRGIQITDAHRATADAEATAALLFHQDIRGALGDSTICDVLRRQLARAEQQNRDFEAWKARQPVRSSS
jgi:DNA polymerase III epsilon subunit-like protein